jgi:S1-C subfamily serine protease
MLLRDGPRRGVAASLYLEKGTSLIDVDGRVIGINQSVAGGAQGIGFATAFVGIQLAPIAALRSVINYDGRNAVAVRAVTSGGPADTSGIAPGDVIQQIDGRAVDSPESAAAAIHAHQPGQTVNLRIWRAGSESSVAVRTTNAPQVGMLPPSEDDRSPSSQDNESQPSQDDSSSQ